MTIASRFLRVAALLLLIALPPAFAEQTGPKRSVLALDYSPDKQLIAIVDGDGHVKWSHKTLGGHDAQLLPDGHILFQLDWTKTAEVDEAGKIVWQYDSATMNGNSGRHVEVHAVQRLPNGATMIAESGPGRLIEVDREGKLLKEIKLTLQHPNPHSDMRNARKLDTGHYLVAQEADGAVCEYDSAGKLVWKFDVPLFGKDRKPGHGPEAFGNQCYSAIRLPNGNTLIGAGNGHSVLEVTPDKQIAWKLEQNDLPGIQFAWVTQVARLPNGNTIFVNCHAGPQNPQVIEVTPDKKVVWTFKDFTHFGNATPVAQVLGLGDKVIR